MDGRGGGPVGSLPMYVKEIGTETIAVPAGKFNCFKPEVGIAGMGGLFAGKYKFFFRYPLEAPHLLVKCEDKQGGLIELSARQDKDCKFKKKDLQYKESLIQGGE